MTITNTVSAPEIPMSFSFDYNLRTRAHIILTHQGFYGVSMLSKHCLTLKMGLEVMVVAGIPRNDSWGTYIRSVEPLAHSPINHAHAQEISIAYARSHLNVQRICRPKRHGIGKSSDEKATNTVGRR